MNVLYHHRTRALAVEGVHIRGIVNGLRRLGHTVDVVAPPGVSLEDRGAAGTAAPSSRWRFLSQAAPEMLFESAEVAYNGYAYPMLSGHLLRKEYRFVYERYALFSVAGVLAAQQYGVPLLLEINDSALVPRIRPLRWKSAARRVEQFVWQRADALFTVSDVFRDQIVGAGVAIERVHVMPNAVDEERFAALPDARALRASLGLGSQLVVGYIGALNHWRRLDLLLDAFAALAERHPHACLLLVGDGPDRAALLERARALGLSARVHWVGQVAHTAVLDHLCVCDVAVLPHSNDYGSPMKLFEYMAAGLPVVAPALAPIAQVVDQGEALLFTPLDGDGLRSALDRLLQDGDERRRIGARAREKVLQHYVWRRHVEKIVRIGEERAEARR